jgi:hypothetical protein
MVTSRIDLIFLNVWLFLEFSEVFDQLLDNAVDSDAYTISALLQRVTLGITHYIMSDEFYLIRLCRYACMGEMRHAYKILVKKLEAKRGLRDPGVNSRIILKLFLKKWAVRVVELCLMARGRFQLPAFVNTVLDTWVT